MKIGITSDHGGYLLKKEIISRSSVFDDVEFIDLGTYSSDRVDYPDFAKKIAIELLDGKIDRGIAICKSGHGMCITLNKFKGVRASLVYSADSCFNGIRDDDLNIISIPANDIGIDEAIKIIQVLKDTVFLDCDRYKIRKDKVLEIEDLNFK